MTIPLEPESAPRSASWLKWALILIPILILLAGAAMAVTHTGVFSKPAFDPAKLGTIETNVPYCSTGGEEQVMDVYYPRSGGPWPVFLYIHGGGWTEGDKAAVDGRPAEMGYLVVSLNYRMYPAYRFPAMIEDVKCAIRSLRAHAATYNLDPARIVLVGHSAGAHLAALAGLADAGAGWDRGDFANESSRVQAVVEISGPTDLTLPFPDGVRSLLGGVFGAEQLVSASPVTYATPDDPPVLIIHGDADGVVPVGQARALEAAMRSAGAPVELIIVQYGGHGLEGVGGTAVPSVDAVWARALAFIEQQLK